MIQEGRQGSRLLRRLCVVAATTLVAVACAPRIEPAGPVITEPRLEVDKIVAADGAVLPLRRWMPQTPPRAAILALHGFNDYSKAFEYPARQFADNGIAVYAYDQRGFGEAPNRRLWPGVTTLVADARSAISLVRSVHPGIPVHVLGLSMGGAVGLLATTHPDGSGADGAILVGPAVWGRRHLGAIPRAALWLFVRIVPWLSLTGKGLQIQPSDNIEMLRTLGSDPLVIKQTRLDAVHGLVNLMDVALDTGGRVRVPTLILAGIRDQLIPARPTRELLTSLPKGGLGRAAVYVDGYHMLLRDLGAARVVTDIITWIDDPAATLPSGADRAAERFRDQDDP